MKIAECLSDDEIRIVGKCIDVMLSGVLIDEREFHIRLGGSMEEIQAIRDCWMEIDVLSKESIWVTNIINDVWGGVSLSEERWNSLFSFPRADLRLIHGKIPRPPRPSFSREKLEALRRRSERIAARHAAKSGVSRLQEKDSAVSQERPDPEPSPAEG